MPPVASSSGCGHGLKAFCIEILVKSIVMVPGIDFQLEPSRHSASHVVPRKQTQAAIDCYH